jgi:hypothetical protein
VVPAKRARGVEGRVLSPRLLRLFICSFLCRCSGRTPGAPPSCSSRAESPGRHSGPAAPSVTGRAAVAWSCSAGSSRTSCSHESGQTLTTRPWPSRTPGSWTSLEGPCAATSRGFSGVPDGRGAQALGGRMRGSRSDPAGQAEEALHEEDPRPDETRTRVFEAKRRPPSRVGTGYPLRDSAPAETCAASPRPRTFPTRPPIRSAPSPPNRRPASTNSVVPTVTTSWSSEPARGPIQTHQLPGAIATVPLPPCAPYTAPSTAP